MLLFLQSAWPPPANAADSPNPAVRLNRPWFFAQPIVPTTDTLSPSHPDSQALALILSSLPSNDPDPLIEALEEFIAAHPQSPWTPCLRNNLGKYYRVNGRYSLALQHWETAWEATQHLRGGPGKRLADYALAHWTRLLVSLGQFDLMQRIFIETQGRALDGGPLSQMLLRTQAVYERARRHPAASYKCGLWALNNVARQLYGTNYNSTGLLAGPESACSLKVLAALAQELQLGLIPVKRLEGEEIVAPSVAHLKLNHYVAILARHGDVYEVADPTFGHNQVFSAQAINGEASGVFLVPAAQVPAGWQELTAAQAGVIYGRSWIANFDDENDQPCQVTNCWSICPPGAGGPGGGGGAGGGGGGWGGGGWGGGGGGSWGGGGSGCLGCEGLSESGEEPLGMPVWRVSEPYLNLWLHDESLRYQPALGDAVSFQLGHKQRDESTGEDPSIFGFGQLWNSPWLSYVWIRTCWDPKQPADVDLYLPGGGKKFLSFPFGQTEITDYYNNCRLKAVMENNVPVGFELAYPDGVILVYGFRRTDASGDWAVAFLSKKYDRHGFATTFNYQPYDPSSGVVRLWSVQDPDGQSCTLEYNANNPNFPNLVSRVADRFGKSASLVYNPDAQLIQITDAGSLSSSIAYDGAGVPSTLTTPYGNTTFAWTQYDYASPERTLIITEPNGGRQLFACYAHCDWITEPFPLLPNAPPGTPGVPWDNTPNVGNSFYWDQHQSEGLPASFANFIPVHFLKARMRHWLRLNDVYGTPEGTLSFERAPSPDGTTEGQVTWYDYAGKPNSATRGTQILPAVISRLLPGTATWYEQYQRNAWGLPTSITSTYGTGSPASTRTYTYNYWDNGLDLREVRGPSSELLASYAYAAVTNHQILTETLYVTNQLAYTTSYSYDGFRRVATRQTPAGLTSTYTYGDNKYLSQITDQPINRTESFTWFNGNVLNHTDARGLTRTFSWDGLGRLTRVDFPDATFIEHQYTRLDRTRTRDRLGKFTYYAYDSLRRLTFAYNNQGLLTTINSPAGLEQSTTYDIKDNPASVTDANGVTVSQTFDYLGRLKTRTYPDGGVERFGYSASGVTAYTNQLGKITAYQYDAAGRKTQETTPNNEVLLYGYNAGSDLTSLRDDKSQYTYWDYNTEGRVSAKRDANNTTVLTYLYDANGRLTRRWSLAKGYTYYTYDDVGNLTFINYPASPDITINYNALNRVIYTSDGSGATSYTYDDAANLATEVPPWSNATVTYGYHPSVPHLRTSLTLQQAGGGTWTQSYGYDGARRLWTLNRSSMGQFTYTYQGAGRLVQNLALPNTANIVNTYDTVRRLTSTTLKNSSQQTRNYHGYLINPANQRTQQTRFDSSYVNYTYDNLGQLQSARGYTAGGTPISTEQLGYFYDTAWNLNRRTNNGVVTTFGVNNLNQLNSGPTGGYQYDGNGNLTADSGFTYGYDDENQLTSITSPNYLRTELVYDARGRLRQRREYYWSGYWVLSDTVNYIYDGNRAIEARGTTSTVSYTRGLDLGGSLEGAGGIGGLLARTSGGSHAYYHADGSGNVTALMDSLQSVVATYRYDSYGRTLSQSGSLAGANVYRFSSKECLANSGLYYFGYRFYAPNLQRWMNRDRLGERWGINLYEFVRNNSLDAIDPDGRIAILPMMIVGGICGAFLTPATVNAPGPADPVYPAFNPDEVCANAVCGAIFSGTIGVVGSKFCPPPQPIKLTICPVSRWGSPNLQPGNWVMIGPKSPCNYVLSGKWQPGFGNQFAPYSSGITYNVPPATLSWPQGCGLNGAVKGLLGQRIYNP